MELPDLKIIGFKVGKRRPTYNKTIKNYAKLTNNVISLNEFAHHFTNALEQSDFLSVRKVEAK